MPRLSLMAASIRRRLRALRHDTRGVAATEFAMLLPLMVTLYLGCVEVSQAVAIDRKVSLTARAVADLVSQSSSITNLEMLNILDATAAVVSPYNAATVEVVVSFIKLDANKSATVVWSDAKNATARPKDQTVTIPSGIAIPNSTIILSEVKYPYKPTIGYVITGTLNLTEKTYMQPRVQSTITRLAT
ncbi:MAG TPA: TadE/TadG family type IV pilus assembly protein [Xanthobacteraceae bacterium]